MVGGDTGSRLIGAFEAIFKCLQITFWNLSHINHKLNSVENCHRFLNKTQAISGQDRVSRDVFIINAKTSQYTCNIAPINDTNVMRSVAAVGREFIFPLDTELLSTPTLNPDNNLVLFKYLQEMSTNSQFAISVLQIIIEERITAHREYWNKVIQQNISK